MPSRRLPDMVTMGSSGRRALQALSHEWARVCAELPPDKVAKSLNRIALNFAKITHELDVRKRSCLLPFLEKHVIRVVMPAYKLQGSGQLYLKDVLEPLHRRALLLGRSKGIQPKDVSLVLNAYAKIYQNAQQSRAGQNRQGLDTTQLLKSYVSQLIPEASRLIGQMNEQDLSLVLNCASKLGVMDNELLNVANNTLVRHLRALYGHESVKRTHQGQPNLLSQFTPQGVSLVVNCFAKSNVTLDEGVLAFIVHKYLPKHLKSFLTQQLAVVLHSFLKLKVHLKDISAALCHLDRAIAEEYDEGNTKLLSASLYTFGKYNYMPNAIAKRMDEETNNTRMVGCSEVELSNMYYGLSKLNLRCTRFVERLNETVSSMLQQFTPQGISTVYYAIARLDMNRSICKSDNISPVSCMNDLLLHRFEELVALNHTATKLEHGNHDDDPDSMKVLPLHLVNVCFSATTCLVLDENHFRTNLSHLYRLFKSTYGENSTTTAIKSILHDGQKRGRPSNQMNASRLDSSSIINKDDSANNDRVTDFITKELGTQGIYQLYCISQHIMMYVKGGLWTQRLEVLKLLMQLFEMWEIISRDKPSAFLHDSIKGSDGDGNLEMALVDPTVTTSRIQADVLCELKAHMHHSHGHSSGGDPIDCNLGKHPLVVTEAQATPYVIDILLCSV